MANGVIIPNIMDIEDISVSGIIFRRSGNTVSMIINSWLAVNGLTVPVGFRPRETQYFNAYVKPSGYDRLTILNTGAISLVTSTNEIVGSFTWII